MASMLEKLAKTINMKPGKGGVYTNKNPIRSSFNWAKNNPKKAVGLGVGAAGASIGTAALLRHLRKKGRGEAK